MYLTQGLRRAARQQPQHVATIYQGRRRTFAEIADRVARLAGALQKLGMNPGDRVGMLALNSDRYLEYYLAVYWGGGAVNPTNIRASAAEMAYALDDCDTHILIVDDAFVAMIGDLRKRSQGLQTIIYAGDGATPEGMFSYEDLIAATDPVDDAVRSGDDLAGIFYTGGTTGFPKGVMLSHKALYLSALTLLTEGIVAEDGVVLHAAPMFHLAAGVMMNAILLRGATHAIVPSFSPPGVLEAIARNKVTVTMLVPTMIQMTVDYPDFAKFDLSSLKTLIYAASPISEAVLDRASRALPQTNFHHAYGMTELAPIATTLPPWYHTAEGRKLGKVRSAGRPFCCTEVRIVDSLGRELPRGKVGEIAVRSPAVMLGYWRKEKETSTVLRDGWMHTGDGGYMDEDGFIFIMDRIKDMIVTGGENVYSVEVENAVLQHPMVMQCAVIGIPNEQWGEAVHAVIALKAGAAVTTDEIREHCKQLIASYKCPRTVEFCEGLPLSAAGKVLKNKLREPFWEGRTRNIA